MPGLLTALQATGGQALTRMEKGERRKEKGEWLSGDGSEEDRSQEETGVVVVKEGMGDEL